jgi:alginate O-acetyltransferase complex protein AlgI
MYFNLAVVWLLTGFWHGANWNFILWGAYFCVILIAEKAFLLKALEKIPAVFRHLYAMLLVTVGFLIFSYTDAAAGWACFCALFGVGAVGFTTSVATYQFLRLLPLILVAAIGATPLPRKLMQKLTERYRPCEILVSVLAIGVLILCTAYLVDSTFSPFAYTQF